MILYFANLVHFHPVFYKKYFFFLPIFFSIKISKFGWQHPIPNMVCTFKDQENIFKKNLSLKIVQE